MAKVFIRKSSYDYAELRPVVYEILHSTIGDFRISNKRVLIKPNLLCPAKPEQAIITHPLVIRAVAEYVLDRGGVPFVSDSNAIGSFKKIIEQSGIKDALKDLDVEIKSLESSRIVSVEDPVIKSIELSAEALDADLVINIPKLKTHSQMLMTLGVKNLFGCVVGMKKPEWHFRVGVDRELFARMLVLVYKAVNPAVTILDGILAMEGDGPGTGGTPRHLGVILASRNTVALDIAACRLLNIEAQDVLTNKIALSMGFAGEIKIDGVSLIIKNFRAPEIVDVVFGPGFAHGFLRRHLTRRPVTINKECKLCGECLKYCPAKAITHTKRRMSFDYDKCIRCYCCLEICPHAALRTTEPLAGRIIKKFIKGRG